MSGCCIVPTGDLPINLTSCECVRCKKCLSCHHCLSAREYLRDALARPRSIQKFMKTEEGIDLILDAILDHQSGDEPPRYILVGSDNTIEEKFPCPKKTRRVSLLPSTGKETLSGPPLPGTDEDSVRKLTRDFPSSKLTVQENLKLLSTKLTNPQTVNISVEPVLSLPSKSLVDEQTNSTKPISEQTDTDSDSQENVVEYPTEFSCDKCNEWFPFRRDLKIHVIYHKIEEDNRQKASEENVVIHRTIYRCDKCEKTFTSEKDLNIHNVYHSVEEVHKCKFCDLTFTYSYELIKHSLKHVGTNPLACKLCKKILKSEAAYAVHVSLHGNPKRFICEICARRFENNFKLKAHFRIHTAEKPFPCERCTKKFRTKSQLQSHNLIHDNVKKYLCFVCDKRFRHAGNLKTHLSKYHDVYNTDDN